MAGAGNVFIRSSGMRVSAPLSSPAALSTELPPAGRRPMVALAMREKDTAEEGPK